MAACMLQYHLVLWIMGDEGRDESGPLRKTDPVKTMTVASKTASSTDQGKQMSADHNKLDQRPRRSAAG